MTKITAEELFKENFLNTDCYINYDVPGLECIVKTMIEFAKLHVKLVLKEASEKGKLNFDCACDLVVNEKKLNFFINSYNLKNIK